jgi:hypothetical protein
MAQDFETLRGFGIPDFMIVPSLSHFADIMTTVANLA